MAEEEDFVKFAQKLNDLGEAVVRAHLDNRAWNERHEKQARTWLYAREHQARIEADQLTERTVAAAERSAAAAEKAAIAATESARWTFWAAIIALVTTVAATLTAFLAWLLR